MSATRDEAIETAGLDPEAVCTLPEQDLEDRLTWIRREILPNAIETARLEHGMAVELADTPAIAQSLDRLIRLERSCCSDIVFERVASATPGRLRLEIRGVDPDAPIFQSIRTPATPTHTRARLVKATGAGVAISFFVCCLLPVVGVALLGAAAAPLASLDGPLPMAGGALIGGAAAWWWLGRPRAGKAATREGT